MWNMSSETKRILSLTVSVFISMLVIMACSSNEVPDEDKKPVRVVDEDENGNTWLWAEDANDGIGEFRESEDSIHIVFLIGAAIIVSAGIFIIILYCLKGKRKTSESANEKAIFKLAGQKNGRLTFAEIVIETSLNSKEAGKVLENMRTKGHAGVHTTDSGVTVYKFFDFESENPDIFSRESPVEDQVEPV